MGILTFLGSLFGCGRKDIGEKGKDGLGKKAVDNESGLAEFYYSYNASLGGDSYSYRLTEEDGKVLFTLEMQIYPENGEMQEELDPAVLESMNELYKKYRIAEWEGYSKYNTMVLDGDGFSLSLRFKDGKSMSASGTNAYPERYAAFTGEMKALLKPYEEELIEKKRQEKIQEGLKGELSSVYATFIQKGKSGSDEYHIHLYLTDREDRKNAEIRVKSVSGEFLPEGEYNVSRRLSKEEMHFSEIRELIEKHEVIRWTDYDKAAEDYNNSEWFQFNFGFEEMSISAMGTEPPENYEAFRSDFLKLMAVLEQEMEEKAEE